jgi:hypothetical protein
LVSKAEKLRFTPTSGNAKLDPHTTRLPAKITEKNHKTMFLMSQRMKLIRSAHLAEKSCVVGLYLEAIRLFGICGSIIPQHTLLVKTDRLRDTTKLQGPLLANLARLWVF